MNFRERWELNKLAEGRATAMMVYRAYERGAAKRGVPFRLTFDRFLELTKADCIYCGAKPSRVRRAGQRMNGGFTYNGIDRMVNDVGYVEGNMVPCCTRCNTAKSNYDVDDWRQWISRVYWTFACARATA